jgi:hypothetical protein
MQQHHAVSRMFEAAAGLWEDQDSNLREKRFPNITRAQVKSPTHNQIIKTQAATLGA